GFMSLYDGMSAQFLRQMTYTTMRFHLYAMGKQHVDERIFWHKAFVASVSGMVAGTLGIPTEMINTRMQVDRMLRRKRRRNYRHVFDGLTRVYREEGFRALYIGGSYSIARAALITVGQNAIYDQTKQILLYYNWEEGKLLHLTSSLVAGILCAPILQPLEVFKTVQMVNSPDHLRSTPEKIMFVLRFGPTGLFRGLSATMCRLIPQTIIMFVLYEEFSQRFGYYAIEHKL
ncbi:hypothetical protein KR222_002197, partial [Zaprionus bogoriensis]